MFRRRARREDDEKAWRAALEEARKQKDDYFRKGPDSPIPADHRDDFDGLSYFDPDPAYRVAVTPEHLHDADPIHIPTSTGDARTYRPVARLTVPLPDGEVTLTAYEQDRHWFIPFKDPTNGKETYGGGRYLEVPASEGDVVVDHARAAGAGESPTTKVVVDLNLAYNPYCAYSEAWSCPLPPAENWLDVPVRAGEKDYEAP